VGTLNVVQYYFTLVKLFEFSIHAASLSQANKILV